MVTLPSREEMLSADLPAERKSVNSEGVTVVTRHASEESAGAFLSAERVALSLPR